MTAEEETCTPNTSKNFKTIVIPPNGLKNILNQEKTAEQYRVKVCDNEFSEWVSYLVSHVSN